MPTDLVLEMPEVNALLSTKELLEMLLTKIVLKVLDVNDLSLNKELVLEMKIAYLFLERLDGNVLLSIEKLLL